mmetsp:Transcript_93425/g.128705  ORF Transcript_93425/g.128705 Transcript_93425/m.128705 type:complete len:331 (-) Transcript_93425:41-1033(-)
MHGLELSSADGVPDTDLQSTSKIHGTTAHDLQSDEHHDSVDDSQITNNLKLTIFIKVSKSVKHVISWDTYLIHHHETILLRVISIFSTNVTEFNTWHRFPVVQVSYLDHKWLHTIVLTLRSKSGKHNSMRAEMTHVTRPEFGCLDVRGVQNKLVGFWIPSSCGLKTCDIGTVTKLSLGIAANHVEMFGRFKPSRMLFVTGKLLNRVHKHSVMKTSSRSKTLVSIGPLSIVRSSTWVVLGEVSLEVKLVSKCSLFQVSFLLLFRRHLIPAMMIHHFWIFVSIFVYRFVVLKEALTMNEIHKLGLIEVQILAFVEQVRVNDFVLDASTNESR